MALKATIYKAQIALADMDSHRYGDLSTTIARHPSETDERMMIRLLAYALHARLNTDHGALELAKDLWDTDEPSLWQKDLTGQILQWIDIGQPDDKRVMRASPRTEKLIVYSFSHSTPVWWSGIATKITRARNAAVWQIPADQSQSLATLAQRTMQLQVTVQDGAVWVSDGEHSIEINPRRLNPG